MPNEFVARNGIIALNNVQVTGSLSVLGNIFQYNSSSYIGNQAGSGSVASTSSIYIGEQAGLNAASSSNSIFLGTYSGLSALRSSYLTALGYQAGVSMSDAGNSTAVGASAGYGAASAIGSAFFGIYAGAAAVSSSYSTFIGPYAGWRVSGSSYSTFIGYNAGFNSTLGNNNILIGTNVTLASGSTNGINIGGLIFGSGSYFSTSSASSGSANGFIGINQPNPLFNLDVSGSARINGNSQITGSVNVLGAVVASAPGTSATITVASIGGGSLTITGNAGSGNPGIQSSGVIHMTAPINGTGGNEILAIRKSGVGVNIVHFQSFGGATLSTITGNGSLGLNKTYANATLDVSGSAVITGSLIISGSNPNTSSLSVIGTGSGVFTVDGSSGRLFSVDDSLSGSLFSVNTAAGLPVIEAFSDNTVRIGRYGTRVLYVSQSAVGVGKEASLNGILDISGSTVITGSLNLSGSFNINGTLTATTLVVQTITSSTIFSSGSNIFGNSTANTQQFTGSVLMTGSLTVNGNTTIINALAIGTSSLGSGENTLVLGVPPNGIAAGEGGQLLLQAPMSGSFTSASMFDNYQNRLRILRGTNAGSDAEVASFNMSSGQMVLSRYTGSSTFPGTSVANLAVDSGGNVITVTPGTVTSASYAATASYIAPGTDLGIFQIATGSVTASVSTGTGSFAVVSGSSTLLFVSRSGDILLATTSGNVAIGTSTLATATELTLSGSQTASSGIARGELNNTTLVASANSDQLVGLEINPTFNIGAFTGTKRFGLLVNNSRINFSGSYTSSANEAINPELYFTINPSIQARAGQSLYAVQINPTINCAGATAQTFTALNVSPTFTNTGTSNTWAISSTGPNLFAGGNTFTGVNQNFSGQAGASNNFNITVPNTLQGFNFNINTGAAGFSYYRDASNLYTYNLVNNSNNVQYIFPTGNTVIQTGGTFVDAGFKLDVSGTARVNGNTTVSGSLNVSGSITSTGTITAQTLVVQTITSSIDFVTGSSRFGSLPTNTHVFTGSVSITGSMLLTGSMGIGTTSPTRRLYVVSADWDNTNGGGVIFENSNTVGASLTLKPAASAVANGSNGWAVYAGGPGAAIADGNLGFWAHGTNEARMVIQRGGNVGIGTTSPTTLLHVSGTTGGVFEVDGAAAVNAFYVSASGNVGIGTTTPTGAYGRLSVAGGIRILDDNNAKLEIGRYSAGAPNSYIKLGTNSNSLRFTNAGDLADIMELTNSGSLGVGKTSPNARLDVNGNAIITGSITATAGGFDSDLTLKDIVTRDLTQYRIADSVSPIIYTWKDTSKGTLQRFGYGAQELLPLIPEAVYQNGSGSTYAVDYTQVHTVLIDENTKRIQALERELAELKQIINALVNNK
jgi:hypothetical protein